MKTLLTLLTAGLTLAGLTACTGMYYDQYPSVSEGVVIHQGYHPHYHRHWHHDHGYYPRHDHYRHNTNYPVVHQSRFSGSISQSY